MEISKEAKERYIARRKENLQALDEALQKKSPQEFKMIGHQLKGNARTFGFSELESVGIELEKVGETQNWSEAKTLLQTLQDWINTHGA
jgi:HPt (histidine-containing phosphotransfer) domain-containing protein